MPITSKFVCLNGRFLKEEELLFDANNRAFRYGDGFFETMHYAFGEIQLFEQHLDRIKKTMSLLKLESNILLHAQLLHKEIVHLINANHYFKGARVRFSIFRNGAGLYEPETNSASYLIESWALEDDKYPLNRKGLKIGIYSSLKKPKGASFFYKSLNTRVSILASIYKQKYQFDDCLLMNSDDNLIESISSNAFFIKDETVYTSSDNSGCIHGIMRQKLLSILPKADLKVIISEQITPKDIPEFDEIFLTNAIHGIQWVGAYKARRYDNKITKKIHNILTETILYSKTIHT